MNKLIILDYSFSGNEGHDEQYDISIAKEATNRNINVVMLCPDNIISLNPIIKPVLTAYVKTNKGIFNMMLLAIMRIIEYRSIFSNNRYNKKMIVLIQSIDFIGLLILLFGVLTIKVKCGVVVIVRRPIKIYKRLNNDHNILVSYIMKYLNFKKNIFFLSDSEMIVNKIMQMKLKTRVLPIPHLPDVGEENRSRINGIVIGYFGGARSEKGFEHLPNIIENIIHKHCDVSFILQTYLYSAEKHLQRTINEIDRLENEYPGKIKTINKYQSPEEYVSYMRLCSIVVLPYKRELYGDGTSGIMAEAIALGLWLVVPSNTWMSAQKEKYKKIVVYDEYNCNKICESIEVCIARNNNMDLVDINQQINSWKAFHSAKNYIDVLSSVEGWIK